MGIIHYECNHCTINNKKERSSSTNHYKLSVLCTRYWKFVGQLCDLVLSTSRERKWEESTVIIVPVSKESQSFLGTQEEVIIPFWYDCAMSWIITLHQYRSTTTEQEYRLNSYKPVGLRHFVGASSFQYFTSTTGQTIWVQSHEITTTLVDIRTVVQLCIA